MSKRAKAIVGILIPLLYFSFICVPWKRTHYWGESNGHKMISVVTEIHPLVPLPRPEDNTVFYGADSSTQDTYEPDWGWLIPIWCVGGVLLVAAGIAMRPRKFPAPTGFTTATEPASPVHAHKKWKRTIATEWLILVACAVIGIGTWWIVGDYKLNPLELIPYLYALAMLPRSIIWSIFMVLGAKDKYHVGMIAGAVGVAGLVAVAILNRSH